MNNVKLQNLRYFVAVYEQGSISAAARKVNATQSGVSVQVRDLEEQLGLTLFDRGSMGVKPTRAGDLIYARAIRILREIGRLGDDASELSGQLTGEVRFGVMPTFARAILAPVISAFCAENPMVEVKVTEGYSAQLNQMVLAGSLDFAVVPDGIIPGGLRSTYLDTDMELLASADPVGNGERSVELARLPTLHLALPGRSNARRVKIDQQLANLPDAAQTVLELDSMMTTLDLVRRGGWCSILPGCLCLPDLNDPAIHLYPIVRPAMTVDYLLVEPQAGSGTPASQKFIEDLSEAIRSACGKCRAHFRGGNARNT